MGDPRMALARIQGRRRLETVMFGIIARFERAFGTLWAHGAAGDLSADEAAWRRLWAATRKDCIDHGQREARMLETELNG